MIAMMAVALGLSGCSKSDKINEDEDEQGNGNNGGNTSGFVIEAKNVASSSTSVVNVVAEMYSTQKYTAKYSNNGFKLTLPASITGLPDGRHTISIWGLDKNGDIVGAFEYQGEKGEYSYTVNYSYATKNMVYEDEDNYEFQGYTMSVTYNCNLKKGWNIEYTRCITDEGNKTRTYYESTEKPSGVNFAWKFYSLGM